MSARTGEYFAMDPSAERLTAQYLETRVSECNNAVKAFVMDNIRHARPRSAEEIASLQRLIAQCDEIIAFAETLT